MLKILKSSLIVVVLLTGCNTTEESTKRTEAHSIEKIKEKKVLITTEALGSNDENIPNYSECTEVIDAKLGYYFTKRKLFIRDNECITSTDSILLNSETNKSIELDGFATGIQRFTLYDKEILQVNSHMGAHTNAVLFFFIEKNGDLVLVKKGIMASDVGEPSVNISSMNNIIEVETYYSKEKFVNDKPCRSLVEDSFRYDYKKREFMKIDSKVTISECKDE